VFTFLKTLSDTNPRVGVVVAEYDALPDLTEQERAAQATEFEAMRARKHRNAPPIHI